MKAEANMLEDGFDLIREEWRMLLPELDMCISDLKSSDTEESGTEVEMGRGGSADCPFPSTDSSSELNLDDDLSEGLLPAYAVALGKENIPKPNNKGKEKMIADFGAPGDYKNSVAFRRALPALVARKPMIIGGCDSVISGDSKREAAEPTWNFPSHGVIAKQDSGFIPAENKRERIELWVMHMQRELNNHPVDEFPPISECDDEVNTDWENVNELSRDNFMVTPTPSEIARWAVPLRTDSEMRHSDQSPTGEHAAEDTHDDRISFVDAFDVSQLPEEPHAANLSASSRPVSEATRDGGTEDLGAEVDPTMVRLPSSRDSMETDLPPSPRESFEIIAGKGNTELSPSTRERREIIAGRGKIAGENAGEARHLYIDCPRFHLRLEEFAQFLENEPADDKEWASMVQAFGSAFSIGYSRPSRSWPTRTDEPDGWGPRGGRPSTPERPVHDYPPMTAEEEAQWKEDWELYMEEEREERMEDAIARGRAAGILDGLAAYRQIGDHHWNSMDLESGPVHEEWQRKPRHFVDEDGCHLNELEEAQLEKAFHAAYDYTYAAANTAGFAGPGPNHIPSLEQWAVGKERIFY